MQFEVFRLRKEGKLLPHHLRWSGAVRGDLYVQEGARPGVEPLHQEGHELHHHDRADLGEAGLVDDDRLGAADRGHDGPNARVSAVVDPDPVRHAQHN